MEELNQMGYRTIRGRSSKDSTRANSGKKIAGPEEMLVDEVPEIDRSSEGRADHEHWNLFTNHTLKPQA